MIDFSYVNNFIISAFSILSSVQSFLMRSSNPNITSLSAYHNRLAITAGPCRDLALYEVCKNYCPDTCTMTHISSSQDSDTTQVSSGIIPYDYDISIRTTTILGKREYGTLTTESDYGSVQTRNTKYSYDQLKDYCENLDRKYQHFVSFSNSSIFYQDIVVKQGVPLSIINDLAKFELLEKRVIVVNSNNKKNAIDRFGSKYLVSNCYQPGDLKNFINSIKNLSVIKFHGLRHNDKNFESKFLEKVDRHHGYMTIYISDCKIQSIRPGVVTQKDLDYIPMMMSQRHYQDSPFSNMKEKDKYFNAYISPSSNTVVDSAEEGGVQSSRRIEY